MQKRTDAPQRDPNLEAILSKRSPMIENIYNKNLRPAPQDRRSSKDSVEKLKDDSAVGFSKTDDRKGSIVGKSSKEPTGFELTRGGTMFFDADSSDYVDASSVNQSVQEYESACHALHIVPSSIVLKALPTTSISLANYGCNSVGVLALTHALKKNFTVTKLNLAGNEIGSLGLKHLASLFSENNSINSLNISKNFFGSEGIKYLNQVIKRNPNLLELDISSNSINDEDGVVIVDTLTLEDNSLIKINLSHNKLGEKTGSALEKFLSENDHLQELNLAWNHFRKKGAISIAKGIWDNNRLTRLNVAWNGFGNEGADMMGKAIAHNMILEELDLRSNRIGNPGFANLCLGLKENTCLKKLWIGLNQLNTETCTSVLKMFASLPSLSLELLDISNMTLKSVIADEIDLVKAVHPEFKCLFGFLNFGERQIYNPSEAAIMYIQEYCEKNNISLMDLFAKLDTDGSMSVSYDEFKEGLKQSGIPITPAQIDALIKYLDKDGDGEIDFSELVIGEEKVRKSKEAATETDS